MEKLYTYQNMVTHKTSVVYSIFGLPGKLVLTNESVWHAWSLTLLAGLNRRVNGTGCLLLSRKGKFLDWLLTNRCSGKCRGRSSLESTDCLCTACLSD